MDLSQLQAETEEWRKRNFPQQSWEHQIMGMIEELGELTHAHLKEEQGIRGTAAEHQAAAKDSVADLGIFMLGYCTYADISLDEAVQKSQLFEGYTTPVNCIFRITRFLGALADTEPLKDNQDYREHCLRAIWFGLVMYCSHRGWDFFDELERTWDRVRTRNWVADPVKGGEQGADDYTRLDGKTVHDGDAVTPHHPS